MHPTGQDSLRTATTIGRRALGIGLAAGALAVGRRAAAQPSRTMEKELVFSARGGSLGEAFRAKIIPPFEAKYGCKVTLVLNDSGPALSKVVAERANPQVDVLWTVEPTHAQGNALGVFEKLDLSRITNYDRLYDIAKLPDQTGVGWGAGATVIGYNAKIYAARKLAAPRTWGDIIIPATKGRVAWLDLSTHQGINSFLMLNRHLGGNETNVDPAFKFLKAHVQDITIVSSPAQLDDLLQQEEAWITSNYVSRMELLRQTGFPLEIVYPEDGMPLQSGILDLLKGAPHPNLAYAFIDWVISTDMQAMLAKYGASSPVNKDTKLDPALAAMLITGPDRVSKLIQFDFGSLTKQIPGWLDRWNRELA